MNFFTVLSFFITLSVAVNAWYHEEHHPRPYKFAYGVSDHHTGDHHEQHEVSDGHVVRGSYSLKEADGTTRIVDYVSGPHTGFQATVRKVGHAHHPQHYGHYEHEHYDDGYDRHSYGNHYGHAQSYVGTTHWGYNHY